MESQQPRHAGPRLRSNAKAIRFGITSALFTVALFGAAFALDNPRLKELLDVRIAPANGQEPGRPGAAADAGTAGGPPPAEARTSIPPAGFEEAEEPLGQPVRPGTASDSYRFLAVNADGTPVGYSPCRPLHYVINDRLAPAGAQRLIPEAITTISAATGISFIYDGTTDEQPTANRPPYQPDEYGERWAPLLIAWTTPEVAPQLSGQVIGTGGSTHYSYDDGPKTFVTGGLDLDAPQIAGELMNPDGHLYATAVILHELSHVMGLDHVEDPGQLMYPEIGTPEGLSAGDLNGLYELGKAQCRKDL